MEIKSYTLADPSTFVILRKARKEHLCPAEWAHDPKIRRGEFYARVKVTPGMGRGWAEFSYHIDCIDPA